MFTLFIQIKCFRPKLRSRFYVADFYHKLDLENKYEKPRIKNKEVVPGPSKLEKVVDPDSGPRGPLPKSK